MSDTDHTHTSLTSDVTVERKPGSLALLKGEVPVSVVTAHRPKALKKLQRTASVPGFRTGHVPESMIIERLGEQTILQEVADMVLTHAYGHLLEEHELRAVGHPEVTITKLAPGNPIGFTITTTLYPEVVLPDYRTLAEKVCAQQDDPEKITVADAEIDAELTRLREALAPKADEGAPKPPIPDLTDEFAQSLGNFKTVDELKTNIKEHLLREQKRKAHEKRRIAIIEAILEKTKVEVPALFIESELDRMYNEFSQQVERAGMKLEDYLTKAEKTPELLRKEWRTDAEKRAKVQLVLSEITKKEGFAPDRARIDREVGHIMEHYSEASEDHVRDYVTMTMLNEMAFELLEGKERTSNDSVQNKADA